MEINPEIFKAYDIRGKYPQEVNAEVGYAVGRAFVPFLKGRYGVPTPEVAVGRDVRLSSPEIAAAVRRGLAAAGAKVLDTGLTTTPMHYWIVGTLRADGGIMVTASHLGKEYNGLKLSGRAAEPFAEADGFSELRAFISKPEPLGTEQGSVEARDCLGEYVSFLAARFSPVSLTVVVDASSGAAGVLLVEFFKRFPGLRVMPLNFEPDGTFPNHDPNPLRDEAIVEIAAMAPHADLGVIFDGDADRVFFLDERGRRIPAGIITAIVAERLLARQRGAVIVYNAPSSRIVPETVKRAGGQAAPSRTGHFFMKRTMRAKNALFGGEHSGHFYFRETFFAEDSMLMTCAVMEILSAAQRPLSEIVEPYQRYVQSGELNFPLGDWARLREAVESAFPEGTADELDGMSIETRDWRFNLRPSNTEPLLRLNAEATDEPALQRLLARLSKLLKSA